MLPQPLSKMVASSRYFRNEVEEVSSRHAFWQPRKRIVFLMHGYNVSIRSAHKRLKKFEYQVLNTPRGLSVAQDLAWFTWPGDMSGFGYYLSAPFYSITLKRAQVVGREFGEWLWELRQLYQNQNQEDLEVVFVAHSLGCRVALEAISKIRALESSDPKKMTIKVFLMAAAVPVVDLDVGGKLRASAERAIERALMHSHKDKALGMIFQIGQRLVRGESHGPAVGRTGQPDDLWGRSSYQNPWGHGDYWKKCFRTFLIWMGYPAPRELPVVLPARATITPYELAVYQITSRWI